MTVSGCRAFPPGVSETLTQTESIVVELASARERKISGQLTR